jgi:hypothetical protein
MDTVVADPGAVRVKLVPIRMLSMRRSASSPKIASWAVQRSRHADAAVFRAHDIPQTRHVLEMVLTVDGYRQPTVCLRGLA